MDRYELSMIRYIYALCCASSTIQYHVLFIDLSEDGECFVGPGPGPLYLLLPLFRFFFTNCAASELF